MQAQTEQSWTRRPSSNHTVSDRTCKLRLDIPSQNGQHQSKKIPDNHEGPDHLRLDTQAQIGQVQLGIPTHTGQPWTGHPTSDLGQSRQPQTTPPHSLQVTFQSRPDSHKDQTFRLRRNSLRPDIQAETAQSQPQTKHSSSDRKASDQPGSDRTAPDQTFQRRSESIV